MVVWQDSSVRRPPTRPSTAPAPSTAQPTSYSHLTPSSQRRPAPSATGRIPIVRASNGVQRPPPPPAPAFQRDAYDPDAAEEELADNDEGEGGLPHEDEGYPNDWDENAEPIAEEIETYDDEYNTGEPAEEAVEDEPAEDDPEEDEHIGEEPIEEEHADEEKTREEDISIEEVPEHMKEAVEGNLKLKRVLSSDKVANGDAKRQKLGEDEMKLKRLRDDLAARWNLRNDSATRYVLEAAELSELEELRRTSFKPNMSDQKMSPCEQIASRVTLNREQAGTPGTALDAVSVFTYRWKLTPEDEKLMRSLNHKDLRYVLNNFDNSRPLQEIVDEAEMIEPEEGQAVSALPNNPGTFTLSRFNRLELIDPVADALVCGDANLTFSLQLATHRRSLGHLGRTLATTFEQIETLRERYPEIDNTIQELEELEAEVLHNVDATRLAVDPRFKGMEDTFGAVYYNFPHAGVVQGFFDGHPFVRWRHENLMHLFFRALRGFVKTGGSVKVCSNSGARGVRYSDILSAAETNEFLHVETVPFLEWQLKDYLRSFGDRRDRGRRPEEGEGYNNQRALSDMVYSFAYAPSGEAVAKPRIRYPPSKQDLLTAKEGKLATYSGEAKKRRVEEMYELFLSYVKGIHIG